MSERLDRRKELFKTSHKNNQHNSKKDEYHKKGYEKRSHLILAKRFKPSNDLDNIDNDMVTNIDVRSSIEFSNDYLHEVILKTKSSCKATQYEGLQIMRRILGSETPHINIFADNNIVVLLSSLLMNTNENIRIEAAWCLTNIATGTHAETGLVLPAIPSMIEILSSDNKDRETIVLKEQICWAIGNIAGDCDEYRTILHANGCLMVILNFLESLSKDIQSLLQKATSQSFLPSSSSQTIQSALQTSAWTISNLARGSISGSFFVNTGKIPYLIDLMSMTIIPLSSSSSSIKITPSSTISIASSPLLAASEEIWWLFAFLTAKEDEIIDYLLSLNLCTRISNILSHYINQFAYTIVATDTISIIPLIRCLGNLTSGPMIWLTNIISDVNILNTLLLFTNLSTFGIVQDGIRNNNTSSSSSSIPTIYRAIIKESLWVVSNILGANISRNIFLEYKLLPLPSMIEQKDSQSMNILSNIIHILLYEDDFHIQQEVICCIEQACLETYTIINIIQHIEFKNILYKLDSLLHIPGSIDIPSSIIRIIHSLVSYSPTVISNQCVEVGITETLENIQYTCNNQELGELAHELVNKFYKYLESEEDNENNTTIDPYNTNYNHNIQENNQIDFNNIQNNITNVYNFGGEFEHNMSSISNNNIIYSQKNFNNPNSFSSSPQGQGIESNNNVGRGRGIEFLQPAWMSNN